MREQNPSLLRTEGARARWYVKPYVHLQVGEEVVWRQKRFYLGRVDQVGEAEAERKRVELLGRLNKTLVKEAEPTIAEFSKEYLTNHVNLHLAESSKRNYRSHLENHIVPGLGHFRLGELTTHEIEIWLNGKAEAGLSWAARSDFRKVISAMYGRAHRWGVWRGANPARHVELGRRRAVRDRRKLTMDQIRKLLESLREDVRLMTLLILFSTMRISEVLGLRWKHVDLETGVVQVRERWYRGDLDRVKTQRGHRDFPLGLVAEQLRARWPGPGHEEEFVFAVQTSRGVTRDDRVIRRHFLRPAAERMGIYHPGFGFHSFRREAITAIAAETDVIQAMLLAGHADLRMTAHYGLMDSPRIRTAVLALQRRLLGLEEDPKT